MFSFFKKKYSLASSGIFQGYTDCHSHILPGVDDGIKTIDESIDTLSLYASLGVKHVWLTPHTMEDIPNTTADLTDRFQKLQQRWKEVHPEQTLTLSLASEYMIDTQFLTHLEQRDFLPHGAKGDHLLVETSYYNAPLDFYETLDGVMKSGFTPILAHPERYVYMDDRDYMKLKQLHVKFQLNITSLMGYYGPDAQQRAKKLLSMGYYNFSGSDLHSLHRFERAIREKVMFEQETQDVLALVNAQK